MLKLAFLEIEQCLGVPVLVDPRANNDFGASAVQVANKLMRLNEPASTEETYWIVFFRA